MESVFKFMVLRPPQEVEPSASNHVDLTRSESALQRDLKQVAESETAHTDMIEVANAYRASASYVASLKALGIPLGALHAQLAAEEKLNEATLKQAIRQIMGQDAAQLVQDEQFLQDRLRVEDSLVATLVSQPEDADVDALMGAARLCGLLDRVAAEDATLRSEKAVRDALTQTVLLPEEIFPLPPVQSRAGISQSRWEELQQEETLRGAARRERMLPTTRLQAALDDLMASSNLDFRQPDAGPQMVRAPEIAYQSPEVEAAPGMWVLSDSTIGKLTPDTIETIRQIGIDLQTTPLTEMADIVEAKMVQASLDILPAQSSAQVVALGDTYFQIPDFNWELVEMVAQSNVERGNYRALGIMDLHVVRKALQKYEAGEVAHIENVLLGESKVRTHRRLNRTEEAYTVETETTEETEQDLQSTERFELEQESQEVIEEENEKQSDFSLDVTAKYGGVVDITANTKYAQKNASKNSKQESTRSAMSYAREVAERTVSRIKERVRTERARKTLQEIEEVNAHTINNVGGNDHIAGIYRWVDKIYKAQIYSYGKRLMFEFIIPEPAAFTIYALKNQMPEGMTLDKPLPPANDQGKPLTPADIKPENYLRWVAQYDVPSVKPPPKPLITIAFAYKSKAVPKGSDVTFDTEVKAVSIPDGYAAEKVFFWLTFATLGARPDHHCSITGLEVIYLFVGTQCANLMGSWGGWHAGSLTLGSETGELPVHVVATHATQASVSAEILCKRTSRRLEEWQLETFSAITQAYQNLKSTYEEELASALVSAGISVTGSSTAVNRELEKTELKKGAISLLIRDKYPHFKHIGSVQDIPKDTKNDYWGYPEINYADAEREAPFIQFFEQAFEWHHMMYTFYPYFWARKAKWPQLQQIKDTDTLFAKFLQAGAARVQVPVRPGYEEDLNLYLLGIEPWKVSGQPSISSQKYLSIVQEIMEKEGVYAMKCGGTLAVTQDSKGITGSGTDFEEDDQGREIDIKGRKYQIASVASPSELTLTEKYLGQSEGEVLYYIGDRIIGCPWYVTVPTTLVLLQAQGAGLPDFTIQ